MHEDKKGIIDILLLINSWLRRPLSKTQAKKKSKENSGKKGNPNIEKSAYKCEIKIE